MPHPNSSAGRLPIYEIEGELVQRLQVERRLILTAPTGSGKSTQVPQILLDHGLLGEGQVVVLQPRRLATRMLAARVASERGSKLGHEVGYQIRMDNRTGASTRIRFVTEGVLLRQMLADPRLEGVAALVFDEFHERHLYGDITLAQALELQETWRPDLRIIVMSATLDSLALERYLHGAAPLGCSVLTASGRMFPVEIRYAETPSYVEQRPVWEQAADVFADFVRSDGSGDVLVFMPGVFEIGQTVQALRQREEARGWVLLPLHGELAPGDQDAAVAQHSRRKVVVATNVAETSLTIDGVRCVIDSGLARQARYDTQRGINTLLIEKISRASADQRAGRAGRTAPGVCWRLWAEDEHAHRAAQELPEVKRLDLAEVVLTLKAAGVRDLRAFRWLDAPGDQALEHAEELLTDLGALQVDGTGGSGEVSRGSVMTAIGRRMLAFPLHPRYARMMLAAQEYGCVRQACLVAALTQGRDLLLRNADRAVQQHREDRLGARTGSDFFALMSAWQEAADHGCSADACRRMGVHQTTARQVGPLFDQFLEIARREGLDITLRAVLDEALEKCILIGFSDRVARRLDAGSARCELVHGRRGMLARESVVQQSPLFVAADVREVGGSGGDVSTILSLATAIEEPWLLDLFPEDVQRTLDVRFDATQRRVVAMESPRFRGLVLSSRRVEPPPADAAARLLAEEVLAGRVELAEWDASVDQWIQRLAFLAQQCPELQLAPILEEDRRAIVEQICLGAFGAKELRDRAVKPFVYGWLGQSQQDLVERHAPERLKLPVGRTTRVTYEPGRTPFIAARIQDLYGLVQTPKIAMGRVPLVVHLLTPGMKPVQVTQDLARFWREHYPRVKSELQRRYPKHEWREL